MFTRAKFYSVDDLSNGIHLTRAEEVLNNLDVKTDFTLADAIEMFNIRLLLENGLALKTWSESQTQTYLKKAKSQGGKIVDVLGTLDNTLPNDHPDSILNRFISLPFDYREDFWKVLEAYGKTDLINEEIFNSILPQNPEYLSDILQNKKTVARFDSCLAEFMRNNPLYATPLLLKAFVLADNSPQAQPIYIPSSLSLSGRERILNEYTRHPEAHPDTLMVISTFKDDPKALTAGPKTRLAAEKRRNERIAELASKSSLISYSMKSAISFDRFESHRPLKCNFSENEWSIIINENYLAGLDDYSLLTFFYQVSFLNPYDFIDLTYSHKGDTLLELIPSSHDKNAYPTNSFFTFYNGQANGIIQALEGYMRRANRGSIESLIHRFYTNVLKQRYGYNGIPLSLPDPSDTTLNKIKIISPEIESLMKQYHLFCKEGAIDPELFARGYAMHLTDTNSLVPHKYAVINPKSPILNHILFLLFSNQSRLSIGSKWKYRTDRPVVFAERLMNNGIILSEETEKFQKSDLDFLVSNHVLKINDEDNYEVADPVYLNILHLLDKRPEISYWHQEPVVKARIDSLIIDGLLIIDQHLLSPSERDYIDYYLNDHKFSNGLSLRNRYLHGVGAPASPEQQTEDYYTLLRILILLLLKINADLALYNHIRKAASSTQS